MNRSKSLAVAGLLSLTLAAGTALTGTASADSTSVAQVKAQSAASAAAYSSVDTTADGHRGVRAIIKIVVDRTRVRRGEAFTVAIRTRGVRDGSRAAVIIDGKVFVIVIRDGFGKRTLRVSRDADPGRYKLVVKIGRVKAFTRIVVFGDRF
jgi:hypothetical protein